MDIDGLENAVEDMVEEWLLMDDDEDSSESESSEEDEPERQRRVYIRNYIENTVHSYSEEEFRSHFRLKRQSAYYLIERLQQTDFHVNAEPHGEAITHERALLMTLWYLANTETFRQVADRFGLSRSSAHRVLLMVLDFLNSLTEEFIRWPTTEAEKRVISDGFARARNIHGIIGAIDGCHVQIRKPMMHQEDYFNRKKYHSILLQAVCTSDKIFIDVYVGEPGSMHDARVLRRSPLYERALGEPQFVGEYFLLGDSAYPSMRWLVPPFRDNGHLSRRQRTFNFRHASTRIKIEHSFGLLRAKFRRLIRLDNLRLDIIIRCVMAACILHNISLTRDATINGEHDENEGNDNQDDEVDDGARSDDNGSGEDDINENQEDDDTDGDAGNADNHDNDDDAVSVDDPDNDGDADGVDVEHDDDNPLQGADRRQQIFNRMFRLNNIH